jgi:hypothetical protein
LKGIKSNKENFDKYFNMVDINRDKTIEFIEFVRFSDEVNRNEIVPLIVKELSLRGLL